jgi:starch-binding outer membrane protein, SusD/RagB family
MKKILIFFLCIGLAGCQDFLEEDAKGQILGDNAINTVEGLDAALTGAYKGLLRTWSRGLLTNGSLQATTMGGDDLTTLTGGNKAEYRDFDQFVVNDQNSKAAQVWDGCYKTIQGANNVINNFHKTNGVKVMIDQIVGEAYFLRALGYYWLVREFGRVPIITSEAFTEEMLTVKVSEPAETYKLIEADLAKAEELLANAKRDPGRPNKGSAKALLADVYLTEGGWPIKDASKYVLAAAKAKEVIDNKTAYGFDLVPELNMLWPGSKETVGTKEEVMAFHTSIDFGGSVNAFWGASGQPGEIGGWDDYFAEIKFFNDFPEGKRKDATFLTEFTKDGNTVTWENFNAYHPYYKKFSLVEPNWASGMPLHLIRYAHVLLIYAEAQARSGSVTQEAYDAVNAVRLRAGLDPLEGLTPTDFANAIVDERKWEFAGEWSRWFDLVRLEMVEEVNADKDALDLKPKVTITKAKYWFPIPQTDAQLNPNLLSTGG